jgi:ribosome-associated translation inhibitor RaiA
MIQISFKNLKKSEFVRSSVNNRLNTLIEKFDDLQDSRILVTLEMENSPLKAGPDLFKVKVYIQSGRFKGLTLVKSDPNLYVALAKMTDNMLIKLNNWGDKCRIKERTLARKLVKNLSNEMPES